MVFILSAVMSIVLWPILSLPAKLINDLIPTGDCMGIQVNTGEMWVCSVAEGLKRCIGPIIVAFVGILFRRPIQTQVRKLTKRVKPKGRFLISPMMATGMFTMVYGGIHSDTASTNGIVSQRTFPAFIGMFTFLAVRLGPVIARKFPGFFGKRDKIPMALRIVLAMAVPLLLAFVLGNQDRVSSTAKKEQWIILITMVTTYTAILPKSGNIAQGARTLARMRPPP